MRYSTRAASHACLLTANTGPYSCMPGHQTDRRRSNHQPYECVSHKRYLSETARRPLEVNSSKFLNSSNLIRPLWRMVDIGQQFGIRPNSCSAGQFTVKRSLPTSLIYPYNSLTVALCWNIYNFTWIKLEFHGTNTDTDTDTDIRDAPIV